MQRFSAFYSGHIRVVITEVYVSGCIGDAVELLVIFLEARCIDGVYTSKAHFPMTDGTRLKL